MDLVNLADFIQAKCVLTDGPYTLSSGDTSDFFIDMEPILLSMTDMEPINEEITEHYYKSSLETVFDTVIGPSIGGLLMAFNLASYDMTAPGFVRIEDVNKRIILPVDHTMNKVLVVDDVLTTGGSLRTVLRHIPKHLVVGVAVIIDRMDSRANSIREDYNFYTLFEANDEGIIYLSEHA